GRGVGPAARGGWGLPGAALAPRVGADVMARAPRWPPPPPFMPPPGIVMTPVDSATGQRACGNEPGISEAFRQGSEPAECESIVDAPIIRDVANWFRGIFR